MGKAQKQTRDFSDAAKMASEKTVQVNVLATETGETTIDAVTAAPQPIAAEIAPWLLDGEPLLLSEEAQQARAENSFATENFPQQVKLYTAHSVWANIRHNMFKAYIADFEATDPELREQFMAAQQTLENTEPDGTAQTEAILLAICLGRQDGYYTKFGAYFIIYLVARYGLPYAVDILLATQKIAVEIRLASDTGSFHIHITQNVVQPFMLGFGEGGIPYILTDGENCMRKLLSDADTVAYSTCVEKIRHALPGLPLIRQVSMALLLPDEPDITNDLLLKLDKASFSSRAIHWLQLTATDPAAIEIAHGVNPYYYNELWRNTTAVNTILLAHRTNATLWLAPGAACNETGDVLTLIGTPDAIAALARVADASDRAMSRLLWATRQWPLAAIAGLSTVLSKDVSKTGKSGEALQSMLMQQLRIRPDATQRLLPWMEAEPAALLTSIQKRMPRLTDIAKDDELPQVLTNPPWTQKKKKAVNKFDLPVLEVCAVEAWHPGHKEEILKMSEWDKKRWTVALDDHEQILAQLGVTDQQVSEENRQQLIHALRNRDVQALIAAWKKALYDIRQELLPAYIDGKFIAHLPAEFGIPLWNAVAPEVPCKNADFVAATWGLPAMPGILARMQNAPADNLYIAQHFGMTEMAPIIARAFSTNKSLYKICCYCFRKFPEHAICGLLPIALGKAGAARNHAGAALRWLAANGHADLLNQVASRYGKEEANAALPALLNENELDRHPAKVAALPDFWHPGGWHRPQLKNGKTLSIEGMNVIGNMMMFPTTLEIYPGLLQVKAACTPESLASFSWDCFMTWIYSGADKKHDWTLNSLGIFGNDDTARRLTSYIRAWPGISLHARAVTGLDVLAAIGSDVALMMLNGIAQKLKFAALQETAREKIQAIARARGLSREELEDRLAPTLELDGQGSMVLDFGPRAFRLGFDECLTPYIREWQDGKAGARLPDLPKAKKTDDETLAKAAILRFRQLKKDVRTIASQQILRLEKAMCSRRRWDAPVFSEFLVRHPLVRHLVTRIIWGVYSDEDILQSCFRVAEDGGYTNAQDEQFILPEGEACKIGVPHPVEMTDKDLTEFAQLLSDYEMLPAFAQLSREKHVLTDTEKATGQLSRWNGVKVETGKLLGLFKNGWKRGPVESGGTIWTLTKPLHYAHGNAVELTISPGMIISMMDAEPVQTLGEINLGLLNDWGNVCQLENFATLDAVAASELIRDMESLKS